MKKVMSVNLGGLVFPIDDEAYDKLDAYLSALQRQFEGTEGADEIIGDIEYRIAEIFQEKVKGGVESISTADVQDIVAVMGAPRDLQEEDPELQASGAQTASPAGESEMATAEAETPEAPEAAETGGASSTASSQSEGFGGGSRKKSRKAEPMGDPGPKRFFRNSDDKLIGGVCSGFAAYIDADPLIVRLAFLLAVLGFGMGPLIYIVLWIIVPEAKTTSEKLQMRGEKVTVESIEKAIRREAKDLKKRFKDFKQEIKDDPKGFEERVEKKANDFFVEASSPFQRLVHGAARLITVVFATLVLIVVLSLLFSLATGAGAAAWMVPQFGPLLFPSSGFGQLAILGVLAVIGIPLILAAMGSLRAVLGWKRRTGGIHSVFLSIWGIALGLTIFLGFRVAGEFGREVSYREEVPLELAPNRPLRIKRLSTAYRDYREDRRIQIDRVRFTDDTVFFGNLDVKIASASGEDHGVYRVRRARGRNRDQATTNAKAITHRMRQADGTLAIDPEFSLANERWRDQELDLIVELPTGAEIVIDESMRGLLSSVHTDGFMGDADLYNHTLVMTAKGLVRGSGTDAPTQPGSTESGAPEAL
jgi:phage shock protein C